MFRHSHKAGPSASFHPERGTSSEHVGIIPDGSRRWARLHALGLRDAYAHAMQRLCNVIRCLLDHGVGDVTIYMSSIQTFRRSPDEIDAFCRSEADACRTLFISLAEERELNVAVAGNLARVPKFLQRALAGLETPAGDQNRRTLTLCVAYDPFDEIEAAVRKRKRSDSLANYLWVKQPLDLVIRTGHANLISNFLPLQAGFARLYFPPCLFNDFTDEDVLHILQEFRALNRMFGE